MKALPQSFQMYQAPSVPLISLPIEDFNLAEQVVFSLRLGSREA